MDSQTLFNVLLTGGAGFLFWQLRSLWSGIETTRTEIIKLERQIHQDFARREDVLTAVHRLEGKLDKLYDMLSEKADK